MNNLLNKIPATPTSSRFVAPWDTSGWYYLQENLKVGSRIYSNVDAKITSLPKKYVGADYIVTFDTKAAKLSETRQGFDFFLERAATVYLAVDKTIPSKLIKGFKLTKDIIKVSNKITYYVYQRKFLAPSHVHTLDLVGDYHHYFVIIKKEGKEEVGLKIPTSIKPKSLGKYQPRHYQNYLNDVFNKKEINPQYKRKGNFAIKYYPNQKFDGYLSIKKKASLQYSFHGSDAVVAKFKLTASEKCEFGFILSSKDKVALIIDHGQIQLFNKRALLPNQENTFELIYLGYQKIVKLYLNHRLYLTTSISISEKVKGFYFNNMSGESKLDNLLISDYTEIMVNNDQHYFAKEYLVHYPFNNSNTYLLKSKKGFTPFVYSFPSLNHIVTVETSISTLSNDPACGPILVDATGKEAMKILYYKNNIYYSSANKWVRVIGNPTTEFCYFPCQNFFNITITIDLKKQVYQLNIDGSIRAKNVPLSNKVKEISGVNFITNKKGMYINKINVYDAYNLARDVIKKGPIFDVKKFGAIADGKTITSKAIQKAIDQAAYTGGTVYFPKGTYLTGELLLRSDINLYIARDAKILGSQDHRYYPLRVPSGSLCANRQLGRGLIYGQNVSNVTIQGGGMIDGQGLYRFKMNDPLADRRNEDARPCLCYVTYSKDIVIEGVNFKSSCFWSIVPLSSQNITFRHLNLDCLNTPNRDGIDPVDCHDLHIYHCNILAGDDGLCFKSSDNYGCENIDVEDVNIESLASAIKFGTDTYYSLKNTHIYNCFTKNVNRCGISLETVDGAIVKNVTFENIEMSDVGAPLYVVVGDRKRKPRGENVPVRHGYIDGVTFKNIHFANCYPFSFKTYPEFIRECMVIGQSKRQMINNVNFINCDFTLPGGIKTNKPRPKAIDDHYPEYDQHGLSSGHAFTLMYTRNVKFKNIKVKLDKKDIRPMIKEFN
ncbi:MAG: glycosyl hydrolase family 28 protein [Bacilli bacterium]|nr:glycosyl hydrolase family 28 protein [Bacilli bacterium]